MSRSKPTFEERIANEAAHKSSSSHDSDKELFFGIGTMGIVGWSVVIPTLAGGYAGNWIDNHHWSGRSWTLALLIAGLCLGCFNAWYWIDQEGRSIANQEGSHR